MLHASQCSQQNIYNCHDMEVTKVFNNRWMDKENKKHVHTPTDTHSVDYCSAQKKKKKEWKFAICNMGRLGGYYA